MRVLQILPELNVGGVETGTVDFAQYLAAHGHGAVVVSGGGTLVRQLEEAGVKHYTLAVHKKSIWSVLRMIKAVRKIIMEERIDIVHARSRVPAWIAYFACRRTSASFITTCHGHYQNRFFSQVMGWPKLVIVPSQAIGRHMIDTFRVSSQSIRCIPRSVDLEKFMVKREETPGKSFSTVAMVGRLTPLKGHSFFLKAMTKVIRQIPNVRIWIIGDAPAKKAAYRTELETLARRLGIHGRVEFLGNRKDVPQLLAQTEVLVLATTAPEAFGRVILEAQAAGVPVVAAKVGGVVDIIDDGKTGLLVPPKDAESIANEVVRLLRDKGLAQQLAEAALAKLKSTFTLERMAAKTLEVYEELMTCMNILVIKMSSVGDVILVTASLKALREKYPKAKIYCLVDKESRKVLQNCPYLDGLIICDAKGKDKGGLRTLMFSHKLRKYRFDKIFDFQNNRRSHLLSFLSFPRESYGFDNGKWGRLLTHPLKEYRNDIPPVEHQFQILKEAGIVYTPDVRLELWPSQGDREYAQTLLEEEWLGGSENIVGVNIAASEKWPTKNWPLDHIARLCDLLSAQNIRVIVTGMAKDKALAQQLLLKTKAKPAIFTGKTDILQLAALIERCKVYVTPDSAPLHIAAAMRTPVVALFGPTDSRRHIPPAQEMVVIQRPLACSPCYSRRCPIMTHVCMEEITAAEVAKSVTALMKGSCVLK